MTQAWLTARLSLSDPRKFPRLEEITGKKRAPARQDAEQLLAAVTALKAMFEGEAEDGG